MNYYCAKVTWKIISEVVTLAKFRNSSFNPIKPQQSSTSKEKQLERRKIKQCKYDPHGMPYFLTKSILRVTTYKKNHSRNSSLSNSVSQRSHMWIGSLKLLREYERHYLLHLVPLHQEMPLYSYH